ncbi:(2Fe-2S)-binding protein [Sphingopyxis sp. MWB1]|uniref:(2Fe-2S)-binding protein n=1 Tax=Sphingopyxis sp. MWB1 TaxID=1537715 RepID=UPI00068F0EE9|nr:(2Fe-2S)-binding protein [Sphingopyxis sp. MWB1]
MKARRITSGTRRGPKISIRVDGEAIACHAGETVAAAMLAAGMSRFRRDRAGTARGLLCNMGVCSECHVTLGATGRRVRACLIEVTDGLDIRRDD